jgi:hypothetical protein
VHQQLTNLPLTLILLLSEWPTNITSISTPKQVAHLCPKVCSSQMSQSPYIVNQASNLRVISGSFTSFPFLLYSALSNPKSWPSTMLPLCLPHPHHTHFQVPSNLSSTFGSTYLFNYFSILVSTHDREHVMVVFLYLPYFT